jgi:hypothetical protein
MTAFNHSCIWSPWFRSIERISLSGTEHQQILRGAYRDLAPRIIWVRRRGSQILFAIHSHLH